MSQVNKIWLFMGQSHMAAQSNTVSLIPDKYRNKYLHNTRGWNGTEFVVYNSDNDNMFLGTGLSQKASIAYGALDIANHLGDDIYILQYAQGGVPLYNTANSFNVDVLGSHFDAIKGHIAGVKSWMDSRNKSYSFEGVVWWQGQADSSSQAAGEIYQANITNLYNSLVTETGNVNLKFYQDNIVSAPSATYAAKEYTNASKLAFTNLDTANRRLYTPDFQTWNADNVHPSGDAYFKDWDDNLLNIIKADL